MGRPFLVTDKSSSVFWASYLLSAIVANTPTDIPDILPLVRADLWGTYNSLLLKYIMRFVSTLKPLRF